MSTSRDPVAYSSSCSRCGHDWHGRGCKSCGCPHAPEVDALIAATQEAFETTHRPPAVPR